MARMRAAVLALALLDVHGFLALRGVNATGPPSWLEGEWGRFGAGGEQSAFLGAAGAEVEWSPSRFLTLHASGTARHDPLGERAGLLEGYADVHVERGLDELRLRAGQFFLPTSRENKDPLWQSPYTTQFSALNSWIGEEVRPVGVDVQYRHVTGFGHAVTAGATAFRGNDASGTLLAWRGWSMGDRLTTYGETLPLTRQHTNFFPAQRNGTQPFGSDLDGRTGWSARLRWSLPERANVQYAFVDNRADRALHDDQYAWATRFHLVSAEIGNPDRLIAAAEYMRGTTGMGFALAGNHFVDADFYAAYVLLSGKYGRHRLSGRYDVFATEERDFSLAEDNDESGRAWTFAWMFDLTQHARLAAEFTQFVGNRNVLPDPDARMVTLEGRYHF